MIEDGCPVCKGHDLMLLNYPRDKWWCPGCGSVLTEKSALVVSEACTDAIYVVFDDGQRHTLSRV